MMLRPISVLSTTLCLFSLLATDAAEAQACLRAGNKLTESPFPACYSTFSCTGSSIGWALNSATQDSPAKCSGNSVKFSSTGSWLASGVHWPVEANKTYTFSVYMKADGNLPQARPKIIVGMYNSSDAWVRNATFKSQSVSKVDSDWEEVVVTFRPLTGEAKVGFKIEMTAQAKESVTPSTFWVSDAYMSEGLVFDKAPSTKVAFEGSMIKVHARGNFKINQGGNWTPFFPICIYADPERFDWATYTSLGFNCNMRAGYPAEVRRGKTAGLYSGYEISTYIVQSPDNSSYNNISQLENHLDDLGLGTDVRDRILFYYWDNEEPYGALEEWNVPAAVAATIDEHDRDDNGNRMHPVFSLQGQEGLARKYNPDGRVSGTTEDDVVLSMSDTVGTYISQDSQSDSAYTQTLGQTILQNLDQQRQPVSIAIFNGAPGDGNYAGHQFRAAAYSAIAHGATGIGYWKDCVNDCVGAFKAPTLESTAWWTDLAGLAAVIQSQLPVIQESPVTTWQLTKVAPVSPEPVNNVQLGTRTYGGKGYVILGNENPAPAEPRFSISGLGYTPTHVVDAFRRDDVGAITSGAFKLTTIPANDGGFYLLGSKVPDTLALSLNFNGNLNDASVVGNSGGVLAGSGAAISGNELVLSGGDVQIPAHPSLEMNGNLTIVAKVNISSSQTANAAVVTKGAGAPGVPGYAFFYDSVNSKLAFFYGVKGSSEPRNTLSATVPSLKGAAHTVAVTARLDGTIKFYVDGTAYTGVGTVRTESRNTIIDPDQPLQIGAFGWGHYLQGSIDDVRIYKAELSAGEISAL